MTREGSVPGTCSAVNHGRHPTTTDHNLGLTRDPGVQPVPLSRSTRPALIQLVQLALIATSSAFIVTVEQHVRFVWEWGNCVWSEVELRPLHTQCVKTPAAARSAMGGILNIKVCELYSFLRDITRKKSQWTHVSSTEREDHAT